MYNNTVLRQLLVQPSVILQSYILKKEYNLIVAGHNTIVIDTFVFCLLLETTSIECVSDFFYQ